MNLTNGELANLRDAAFERKDYSLMVQVESELNTRNDLTVINHRVIGTKRTHLYHCPVCRRWSTCYSATTQQRCQERRHCTDCRDSGFIQLQYRIALLEQAMRTDVDAWDASLPAPVPLKLRAAADPAMRPHYLALYERCRVKRDAFVKQLQEVSK